MIIELWNKALRNELFADWLLKLISHWRILLTHSWGTQLLTTSKRGRKLVFFISPSGFTLWHSALAVLCRYSEADSIFKRAGEEGGVLRNQHTMSSGLCERQRLVKDGYCFRKRQKGESVREREEGAKEGFKRHKIKETKTWKRQWNGASKI